MPRVQLTWHLAGAMRLSLNTLGPGLQMASAQIRAFAKDVGLR